MSFKISVAETGEIEREISIEISRSVYNEKFESALKAASRQARMKGFRPGKVPAHLISKMYGERIHYDVMGELVSQAYETAIKDNALAVVGNPEVSFDEEAAKDADLSVKAKVLIEPKPKIVDYFGVKVAVDEEQLTDEVFDEYIKSIQKSYAKIDPVEGRTVAEKGDVLSIDFIGEVDGEPFAGCRGEDQQLSLEDPGKFPGLLKALIGIEIGAEQTIKVTLPKDYSDESVAGKKATFTATIKGLYSREIPELDDAFAKKTQHAETIDEFKTKVRENLEKEVQNKNKQVVEEKVFEAIASANEFAIPQPMIDGEIRSVLFRFGALDPNKRESYAADVSQFRDALGEAATKRVRNSVILERVIAQEAFTVSDAELEDWLNSLAEEHSLTREELDKQLNFEVEKDRLKAQAVRQKMVDQLIDKAKIKKSKKLFVVES